MTAVDSALLGVYTTRCAGGAGRGLDRFLPPERTTFYGYGRQALAEALGRSGVGEGDTVLLPSLICCEVLSSLAAIGGVPAFYEVDDRLETDHFALERAAAGKKARAVVAVNYFGFPQPLGSFTRWCRTHDVALIEDNAHGFLSSEGTNPLGQRGDFGVFSLRKTLALPNGAALVDNRCGPHAGQPALEFTGSPWKAEQRYRLKAALKGLMAFSGLSAVRTTIDSIRLLRRLGTGSSLPLPPADAETAVPRDAFAPLSARLLQGFDLVKESARRRLLYQWCQETLARASGVQPLFPDLPEGVVPQGFPFLFRGGDPDGLMATWWRLGVPISRWPTLPSAIRPIAPAHYRTLMVVPFLW